MEEATVIVDKLQGTFTAGAVEKAKESLKRRSVIDRRATETYQDCGPVG